MAKTTGADSQVIYRGEIKWESPQTKAKNNLNVTAKMDSKIRLKCKDDYNKRGGALGYVECALEGIFKEIVETLPPPPAVVASSKQEGEPV
jgi:hypothetical protein